MWYQPIGDLIDNILQVTLTRVRVMVRVRVRVRVSF